MQAVGQYFSDDLGAADGAVQPVICRQERQRFVCGQPAVLAVFVADVNRIAVFD